MPDCPTCGDPLAARGLVQSQRDDGATATRALWECPRRHRFASWTDGGSPLVAWTSDWWPRPGTRPDLEADRPPHWG